MVCSIHHSIVARFCELERNFVIEKKLYVVKLLYMYRAECSQSPVVYGLIKNTKFAAPFFAKYI